MKKRAGGQFDPAVAKTFVREADDAVQEAWLRLHRTDTATVENLAGRTRLLAFAAVSLLGWMLLLGGCAVGLFQRQELARE